MAAGPAEATTKVSVCPYRACTSADGRIELAKQLEWQWQVELLFNRGRDCGGRRPQGSILDSAEPYEPSARTFSYVSTTMSDGRTFQTATRLEDACGLVAGGVKSGEPIVPDTTPSLDTAARYDPRTGKLPRAGTRTEDRVFPTATVLGSGTSLIAGGDDQVGNPGQTAAFSNRSSGAWTATTGTNEGESRVSTGDSS
jgi:hypothetical protein